MTKKPALNNKLIDCVLAHIEHEVAAGTGGYNQNVWAIVEMRGKRALKCDTQACFAGWACLLSTPQRTWYNAFNLSTGQSNDDFNWEGLGKQKLGLTEDEADYLFCGKQGTSKQQLAAVKERVNNIRKARALKVDLQDFLKCEGGRQWLIRV
jgi:hypothetical protein